MKKPARALRHRSVQGLTLDDRSARGQTPGQAPSARHGLSAQPGGLAGPRTPWRAPRSHHRGPRSVIAGRGHARSETARREDSLLG
jgi:hypothetical protein